MPQIIRVLAKILKNLPGELVTMIDGDHSVSDYLLDQKFDYIFFTGSPGIGKYVMQKASQNLTPFSLELGGKNPCVVAADARLDLAAKRIVWGKFLNCGQTCVSPDYLIVDRRIKDKLLELISGEILRSYGANPEDSSDFARLINAESVVRLGEFMKKGKIVTGGVTNPDMRYMAPTVLDNIKPGDPVMQKEIFGPVLPLIEFAEFNEVYTIIENNPKPLSSYIFTQNRKLSREFIQKTQSGNSCVNETVMQIASPYLPYGGIGTSGMGRYHGRYSFETFSNMRSVLVKSNLFDPALRYPPYSKIKTKLLVFLKKIFMIKE